MRKSPKCQKQKELLTESFPAMGIAQGIYSTLLTQDRIMEITWLDSLVGIVKWGADVPKAKEAEDEEELAFIAAILEECYRVKALEDQADLLEAGNLINQFRIPLTVSDRVREDVLVNPRQRI